MSRLKGFIINYFPFLGKYKRFLKIVYDTWMPVKKSYSQYGEDVYINTELKKYQLKDELYLDIGANHPSDISNTYLLYRKGFKGIIIEPNEELIGLFRKFRKRDITLMIGCSNESTMLRFNISKTPVLSSFSDNRTVNTYKQVYLPVMPLDLAIANIPCSMISLLSIDVEGLNHEVLQGATQSIKKSLLLCIEFDTDYEKGLFDMVLKDEFDLIHTFSCNLIYRNKRLAAQLKK